MQSYHTGLGPSRHVPVAPGASAVAAVPLELRGGPKFYLIFNGLQKGDDLVVDGISLRDLE